MPYPTLVLKSGRDRSVRNRHPWLFSGAIKQLPKAKHGDIVAVSTNQGEVLAHGFFNPKSQIVCRLFHFGDSPFAFEEAAYWVAAVQRAHALRQPHLTHDTTCFRLLHAEGDGLPGVIADVYGEVVVLQLLIKGMAQRLPFLLQAFSALGYHKVWLKTKKNARVLEGVDVQGGWLTEATSKTTRSVQEHGLHFNVDIETGQKTGFFLDQRENRALVQRFSAGKRVLNAFSYTGGFSVYALAGGAAAVDSVDSSEPALALAEENVRLNFSDAAHQTIAADCFDFLREDRTYDLIVLDPPAFAKHARAVRNASHGYKDINLNAMHRLTPGGLLFTFSCSQNIDRDLFRKIVFGAAADAGRTVRVLYQLSQPPDHPINIYHPEGEYLKGLVLHVE